MDTDKPISLPVIEVIEPVVQKKLDESNIEWTGVTWNPWQGCIKVSPECKNCYMYRDKKRYGKDPKKIVRSSPATFNKPLKWQREVEQGLRTGINRYVFTCSWSDWFIEQADGWRAEAWEIVRRCPGLIFQILTKRHNRMIHNLPPFWEEIRDRVILGVSCGDEQTAELRLPVLGELKDLGFTTFVSYEPALGPVPWSTFGTYIPRSGGRIRPVMDQLISGGESGPGARISHPDLHRAARDFAVAWGVKYLFKQWGEWWPLSQAAFRPAPSWQGKFQTYVSNGSSGDAARTESVYRVGKKAAGRLLDGREWNEMPATAGQAVLA
jgi:protein gp37